MPGKKGASLTLAKAALRAFLPHIDRLLNGRQRAHQGAGPRVYFALEYDHALGFVALSSALYAGLKQLDPACRIVVACGPLSAAALRANPFIDQIVCLPSPLKAPLRSIWALILWRLKRGFRLDVCIQNGSMARYVTDCLLVAAGPGYRVGRGPSPIYDKRLTWDRDTSVLSNILAPLEALGLTEGEAEPRIFFDRADMEWSTALLKDLCADRAPRIAYATQTSGGHPNAWWPERFAALADELHRTTGATSLFLGADRDAAAIADIMRRMQGPAQSLAGGTSLTQLAALIANCDLLISLDTGTLHLARGTRTPTVVIAPAHQPRLEWLPSQDVHTAILRRDDISCRECRLAYCQTRECMDEISSSDVAFAANAMLRRFPPTVAAREMRSDNSLSDRSPALVGKNSW
jgi:ADP-heptose:LPS heptosyltransferase